MKIVSVEEYKNTNPDDDGNHFPRTAKVTSELVTIVKDYWIGWHVLIKVVKIYNILYWFLFYPL